jgi:hypothetical protein
MLLRSICVNTSAAPVSSPGTCPTKLPSLNYFYRPISRAMCSLQGRPRSSAVPFGMSSSHGICLGNLPRNSENSWIRLSSSGPPGDMRSIGPRRGREGGHRWHGRPLETRRDPVL